MKKLVIVLFISLLLSYVDYVDQMPRSITYFGQYGILTVDLDIALI